MQLMSYTNDGSYGVGTVTQQAMDIYPTPANGLVPGSAITAINMACLDPARAGAITIAGGGAAAIACPSTTANSRLLLMYIGGVASGTTVAAATFVRNPGVGYTVTATPTAQYHYLIIG